MLSLLTINWNPDPELFNFFGISIRYYGLLWIIGLAFAYLIVQHQYRDRKIDEKKFEPLFFYCFFGILIGARLGHCIFYDWAYYQDHFVEMILPIKQTAAGLLRYVRPQVPIYLIDPKEVKVPVDRSVRVIQKGASEGVAELIALLRR